MVPITAGDVTILLMEAFAASAVLTSLAWLNNCFI
jgi:hypothetical protein